MPTYSVYSNHSNQSFPNHHIELLFARFCSIACEETLAALRANAPTLLGLLDVFTWEPLAEWTAADGHVEGGAFEREERQGMEVAVSLSLLASRLQEQQQAMQVGELGRRT